MKINIPSVTIKRLSLYYRALLESRKKDLISSNELSNLTGFKAAQIRRDLAYFGQFGVSGKGYEVEVLKKEILKILGIDKEWRVALVGVGNLGSAFLSYKGFREQGFNIVAAFDNDVRKIGKTFGRINIQDISEIKERIDILSIKMAIVTVPASAAQSIINLLVKYSVKAILNFAPIRPNVPKNVELLNIDLSIELERLAYFLKRNIK
ncbi:MAG: redox-sensing transcriptional repressor Rex [Candidatus Omnitrophica bacterium]|nr:redox-sensing transcriptional repressor Rex [Candidatus Omnitrophota bacterium]